MLAQALSCSTTCCRVMSIKGDRTSKRVTGLTAVPPLYIQLTQLTWPETITEHLRYFANTGGRMPRETLMALRKHLPKSKPFLMYGLTEAFRSTYLPPAEVDKRPDSIGKAIPNAEISCCAKMDRLVPQ
jgi:acyl-CoA synthetase (AMP-forming)/AMP-acid ligase II